MKGSGISCGHARVQRRYNSAVLSQHWLPGTVRSDPNVTLSKTLLTLVPFDTQM